MSGTFTENSLIRDSRRRVSVVGSSHTSQTLRFATRQRPSYLQTGKRAQSCILGNTDTVQNSAFTPIGPDVIQQPKTATLDGPIIASAQSCPSGVILGPNEHQSAQLGRNSLIHNASQTGSDGKKRNVTQTIQVTPGQSLETTDSKSNRLSAGSGRSGERSSGPIATSGGPQRYSRLTNEVIGHGSFKTVYKAFDVIGGKEVAWNQISLANLTAEARKNIHREIQTLRSINNQNIIKFYDTWYDEHGDLVFITELLSSGTLRQYLHKMSEAEHNSHRRGSAFLHGASGADPVIAESSFSNATNHNSSIVTDGGRERNNNNNATNASGKSRHESATIESFDTSFGQPANTSLGPIAEPNQQFGQQTQTTYKRQHVIRTRILKEWCKQILRGLRYLHTHTPPIVHRDLKCDNIFISGSKGTIKIGDLGLANFLLEDNNFKLKTLSGTPEFMPYEMFTGNAYDEKVDIYAFGLCVLEIITGDYPYSECTHTVDIINKVKAGVEPEALSLVHDPALKAFIKSCISPDPKVRPSADELLADQVWLNATAAVPSISASAATTAAVSASASMMAAGSGNISMGTGTTVPGSNVNVNSVSSQPHTKASPGSTVSPPTSISAMATDSSSIHDDTMRLNETNDFMSSPMSSYISGANVSAAPMPQLDENSYVDVEGPWGPRQKKKSARLSGATDGRSQSSFSSSAVGQKEPVVTEVGASTNIGTSGQLGRDSTETVNSSEVYENKDSNDRMNLFEMRRKMCEEIDDDIDTEKKAEIETGTAVNNAEEPLVNNNNNINVSSNTVDEVNKKVDENNNNNANVGVKNNDVKKRDSNSKSILESDNINIADGKNNNYNYSASGLDVANESIKQEQDMEAQSISSNKIGTENISDASDKTNNDDTKDQSSERIASATAGANRIDNKVLKNENNNDNTAPSVFSNEQENELQVVSSGNSVDTIKQQSKANASSLNKPIILNKDEICLEYKKVGETIWLYIYLTKDGTIYEDHCQNSICCAPYISSGALDDNRPRSFSFTDETPIDNTGATQDSDPSSSIVFDAEKEKKEKRGIRYPIEMRELVMDVGYAIKDILDILHIDVCQENIAIFKNRLTEIYNEVASTIKNVTMRQSLAEDTDDKSNNTAINNNDNDNDNNNNNDIKLSSNEQKNDNNSNNNTASFDFINIEVVHGEEAENSDKNNNNTKINHERVNNNFGDRFSENQNTAFSDSEDNKKIDGKIAVDETLSKNMAVSGDLEQTQLSELNTAGEMEKNIYGAFTEVCNPSNEQTQENVQSAAPPSAVSTMAPYKNPMISQSTDINGICSLSTIPGANGNMNVVTNNNDSSNINTSINICPIGIHNISSSAKINNSVIHNPQTESCDNSIIYASNKQNPYAILIKRVDTSSNNNDSIIDNGEVLDNIMDIDNSKISVPESDSSKLPIIPSVSELNNSACCKPGCSTGFHSNDDSANSRNMSGLSITNSSCNDETEVANRTVVHGINSSNGVNNLQQLRQQNSTTGIAMATGNSDIIENDLENNSGLYQNNNNNNNSNNNISEQGNITAGNLSIIESAPSLVGSTINIRNKIHSRSSSGNNVFCFDGNEKEPDFNCQSTITDETNNIKVKPGSSQKKIPNVMDIFSQSGVNGQ